MNSLSTALSNLQPKPSPNPNTTASSDHVPLVFHREVIVGHPTQEYMTISLVPRYLNKSHEEVRLEDYAAVGRFVPKRAEKLESNSATIGTFVATKIDSISPPLRRVRASSEEGLRFDHKIVSLKVGTDPITTFTIHENLLTARSEFVRLALCGEGEEASTRTIPLPEDDPAVFTIYQQHLYTGLIHTRNFDETSFSTEESKQQETAEYSTLVEAYILGSKLLDTAFKDALIDSIIEKLRAQHTFDTHLTRLVFENTPLSSPLRRLWIDIYYFFGKADWLADESDVSEEFSMELAKVQMLLRGDFGAAVAKRRLEKMFGEVCEYHEHAGGECHRKRLGWVD